MNFASDWISFISAGGGAAIFQLANIQANACDLHPLDRTRPIFVPAGKLSTCYHYITSLMDTYTIAGSNCPQKHSTNVRNPTTLGKGYNRKERLFYVKKHLTSGSGFGRTNEVSYYLLWMDGVAAVFL